MRSRRTTGWGAFSLLLAVVAAAAIILWWQWDRILPSLCRPALQKERSDCVKRLERLRHQTRAPSTVPPFLQKEVEPDKAAAAPERAWTSWIGVPLQWPQRFPDVDCWKARSHLQALCRQLDQRDYLRGRLPQGGTFTLLRQTVEALMERPPVGSGEILYYDTLIGNIFHFFRTLGRKRIELIRDILRREDRLVEPASLLLFQWLLAQEKCPGQDLTVSPETLYTYAVYLLETIGGRSYLSRRSPRTAALAGFYALVIVDRAMRRGFNPHGIDPRPHIRRVRERLARQQLAFAHQYLQYLQQMEERWGPPP